MKFVLSALASFLIQGLGITSAAPWNLPQKISDQNAKVGFEVDSTWHLVHGTTGGLSGGAQLSDPKDFRSLQGNVNFPVENFLTGSKSRDTRLREVMDSDRFPNVKFEITSVRDLCEPERVLPGLPCEIQLIGSLTIRDVTKEIISPAKLERRGDDYYVQGKFSLRWEEYGVEDPSIFIAKLDPSVLVDYEIDLKKNIEMP